MQIKNVLDPRVKDFIRNVVLPYYNANGEDDEVVAEASDRNFDIITRISPDTNIILLSDQDEIIGASTLFPVTRIIMDSFLKDHINEEQLFDALEEYTSSEYQRDSLDCLYLTSVFVVPKFRGKGYGIKIIEEHIKLMDSENKKTLFAWLFSEEGSGLWEKYLTKSGRTGLSK